MLNVKKTSLCPLLCRAGPFSELPDDGRTVPHGRRAAGGRVFARDCRKICIYKGKDPYLHRVEWTFLQCFVWLHDDSVVVQAQSKWAFCLHDCACKHT